MEEIARPFVNRLACVSQKGEARRDALGRSLREVRVLARVPWSCSSPMVLRVIDERFALDALAGKGATGSVFSARDLRTGERVAVKVLLGGRTMFPRFDREVEV